MRRRGNTLLRSLCIAAAFGVAAGIAQADDLDLAALRTQATAGNAEAGRALGEALLYGISGAKQDIPAGIALLRQAAEVGDVAAQATLGKVLLDGYYIRPEPDRAFVLLETAADAGSTRAQITLAEALLWGFHTEADPERAKALFMKAREAGDPDARRILGEQLVAGWALERDLDQGRALLEEAIAEGDDKAKVILASFYLYGIGVPRDRARALMLSESAAETGNGAGLKDYGTMLMWSLRDRAGSETILKRAGELGEGAAWSTLAEGAMYGYLAGRSRAKFDDFAEKAVEAGETRIAVLQAERQMWGISMRASGPATLAGLEAAADEGNKDALHFLIPLVRDGNHLNIRKDPERARGYLERYAALLSPDEIAQYTLSIDAAKVRIVSAYPALRERFLAHPELKSSWFGEQLYKANPNFAIYLLQYAMKADGSYFGKLDGLATRTTINALWRACEATRHFSDCANDVLQPKVIGALLAR
ncbi:sel1 repeat family protein [Sinirhodobacter sp. WL0062]|uniref:Sel1 repeat family protein n=1 Tax=Rhodobacter flavimaris TaxID=2907145 RepID=A0ABS8YU91_9RHOB|nr:tetratricopeptide repeat protein [Sinirhodobacter sp. WL0062]MCE5973043.1 sel1 repeat family protein [Sinirhodobacter sp. WL0062]